MGWWQRLRARRLNKEELRAAPSSGFDRMLTEFKLDRAAAQDRLKCKFCQTHIAAIDEVAAIFPESGSIKVVCLQPRCLVALAKHISDGKVRL